MFRRSVFLLAFIGLMNTSWAQIGYATYNPPTSGPSVCLGTSVELGRIVIPMGDSNGNGLQEFAVADSRWTSPTTGASTGAVFVYEGAGNQSTIMRCYQGDAVGGLFGYSLIALSDMNGDGALELAALQVNAQQQVECWLLYSGLGPQRVLFTSTGVPTGFGVHMALVDEVDNRPGADLVIFHTTYMEIRSTFDGAVLATANVVSPSGGFNNQISMNDMNGDGWRDIAIGDVNNSITGPSVAIYSGAPASFGAPLGTITPPTAPMAYGFSLASMGDVTGDGLGDLLIGAPKIYPSTPGSGFAVIASCSPAGCAELGPRVYGGALNSNFGRSVARLAPEPGSTLPDFVVGADNGGNPGAGGSIHVFAVGVQFQKYQLTDPTKPNYGWVVGDAGDLDGDGLTEIHVSAGAPSHPWVKILRGAGTASTTSVGVGCATPPSSVPTFQANFGSRPVLGGLFTAWYRFGVPNAPAATYLGFRQNPPLMLSPGCLVHVDLTSAVQFSNSTDVIGQFFLQLFVPNDPSLIGTSLTLQTVQLDAGFNIVLSNGLDVNFGY